ncbi:MAG: GAF domain-containing sensor histidine kinase [Chloroflexi bacterium]|nr:GAF domain-containing sensor histidine kinase [Chloroflexota bacterium]
MPTLVSDDLEILRDENRRLRALVEFGRHVTAERDLVTQVRMLCRELQPTTGCAAAAVVVYKADGNAEAVETVGFDEGHADPIARALHFLDLRFAFESRSDDRAVRMDVATDARLDVLREPLLAADLKRAVVVPLAVGDERLGAVLTFDDGTNRDFDCLTPLADAAAMAIQNARMYAAGHRELRQREALRAVIASISSELDLDSLLARVVAGAVQLCDAQHGIISFVESDGNARVRAVHNLPPSMCGRSIPRGDGLTGLVLARGGPAVVDQYADVPRPLQTDMCLGAAIGVPIWWQDQILGVFGIFAARDGQRFDVVDRQAMEMLANHVAIAIENARLYGEVRWRLAELTGLQAASTALVEELQPERALRVLAEQALALSGAGTVSIELLRGGSRELEVQVAVGDDAVELAAKRVSVEGSLRGAAVRTGLPQLGGGSDPGWTSDRAMMVVPLRARGRTLGTLSAYTHDPDVFRAGQLELLTTFANQAAISLDNARLYAELQSRLEEMVGLQRLGTLLLEEHDFDRVLQAICEQLQRLTDAGGVGLALLEDDPRFLEMRTVVGPSAGVLRGMRIPTDASFAAEALRTNRPQRSDDAQHDPRGYKKSLILGNTRTILSVPMKTRRRSVGVLSVYNKQGQGGFTDRDAELATFFANQAAAAIENARLYEQTREYAVVEERNRLARELHDSVTQSLFSVSLLSEAALSLLDRDAAKARERLERANELAQGALAEMRALIFQLRPVTLQEEGLLSAVKKHLAALHSRHGRLVELRVTGTPRRLPAPVEDAAFRIVQESLNNVFKHANAQRIGVELRFEADMLRVCTHDDGVGFEPSSLPRRDTLGMSSMRERAESVGGRLSVQSAPGQGARISAELPVQDAD